MRASALYRFYWSPAFFVVSGFLWLGVTVLIVWFAYKGWKLLGLLSWMIGMTMFEGTTERPFQVYRRAKYELRRRRWLKQHPGFD